MSEFVFQKSQRVIVPPNVAGAEGVQGVVTGYSADLGREPSYTVQWPTNEFVRDTGEIRTISAFVNESELVIAQPPKMIPQDEADKAVAKARLVGMIEVRLEVAPKMQRLNTRVAQLERAAALAAAKAKRAGTRKRR